MGVAEEPAVVTGIQVPSAGCSTLPSGNDQTASSTSVESTDSKVSRMSSAESSSTTTGSETSSLPSCVQPESAPTAAATAVPAAAVLRNERRVSFGARMAG